ncbi:Vancomycin resistance protein YoaR, contains peptidoglycan-binding and VanW domains [Klenkia marina]|uniref:Vancomycin resistance protein YoaR, contains peptidoglycan-binding and VanW domains n=1 Tax=Klenkia marina TaxID=1960309 RepID=A0A1G4YUA0_9ACTN|nr:VanW family protein [Klenkia marina]SCX57019.1 Vancomycin resistance protein YoaR, contains peptidoglycan-binding and VanW domains [Klenkia marina]
MSDETNRPEPDQAPEPDRTARLEPDGTIGSGRPAAPGGVSRPQPQAAGWGGQTPEPVVPPGQPLPVNPRRRAADEATPPPVADDDAPTGRISRATATPVGPSTAPVDGAEPAVQQPVVEQSVHGQPVDERPAPDAPAEQDAAEQDAAEQDAAEPDVPDGDASQDDAAEHDSDAPTAAVPAVVVPADVFDEPTVVRTAEPDEFPPADRRSPASAEDDEPPRTGSGHLVGPSEHGRSRWRRPAVLVPLGVLALLGVVWGADLALAGDDVPRNTVVAGVEIGGLSPAAAAETLSTELAPRVTADHVIVADDVEGVLSPATAGITLDVDATVDAASGQPLNPWTRLVSLFTERTVEPVITGEETALAAQIDAFAETVDRAPADATIAVEGTDASVVPPVTGRQLDRDGAGDAVTDALASGGDPSTPIELPVDTTDVQVDEQDAQQALDDVVTPALSAPVTVRGDDGTTAELDVAGIASALRFAPGTDGALEVTLDPAALRTALGDQLGEFGTPAQDARFQITGDAIAVVPSVDGTGIDPAALATSLRPVLTQPAPREVTASLGAVPADFTTDEANALGIVEPVSSFTTNFTNGASGTNIRVVAEFVDGAVVLPGETFSLNGYTGPRGEAQGYVPAGVINNGEFTQAVGGGISQFATTMFNAVFFAGLEDVYHKPHSYYISRYPAGREATVYYDSIDLKWRNDSETGIYVQTQWVAGGSITVTFWGTKRYEIESVSSERFNVRTPVVQEKPDDGNCNPQGGANGFDITVTRIFEDPTTGAQLRTEQFNTRYAAEPVIRCIPVPEQAPPGTAPGAPAQPTGRRPRSAPRPVGT